MTTAHPILDSIRDAMEHHPHIHLTPRPVHLSLDKDPFIDAGEIAVDSHGRTVTLRGVVHGEAQRRMAENDVWYVFGVDQVENHLTVLAP